MTDQPKPDAIAADRLTMRLTNAIKTNKTEVVAGYALVQANMAHCSMQAIIDLLRHKGVISEQELSQALASNYNKRADSLVERSIIAPPAPQVRPKDH
jgi:predicted deacylase